MCTLRLTHQAHRSPTGALVACGVAVDLGSARIGDGTREIVPATPAWGKPASSRLRHTSQSFVPGNRLSSHATAGHAASATGRR